MSICFDFISFHYKKKCTYIKLIKPNIYPNKMAAKLNFSPNTPWIEHLGFRLSLVKLTV